MIGLLYEDLRGRIVWAAISAVLLSFMLTPKKLLPVVLIMNSYMVSL